MKIGKKLKLILAASIICISATSIVGCNNLANEKNNNNKQEEQKIDEGNNNETTTSSTTEDDKENKNTLKDKKSNKEDKDIIFYTYDINTEKLTEHTKKFDEISVANVIDALVESNVLPKGTKVKTAKVEDVDSLKTLIVDVNSKFVNFDQGSTQESLQIQCFANSLIKTFNVKQVLLTVDGNPYAGGHIALDKGEMLKYK